MAKMTINQALLKAVAAYKSGDAAAAEKLFSKIIKIEPKHPDANSNMGRILVESGNLKEALSYFKTALEANFSVAQYWFNYIDVLFKLDRFTEASQLLVTAKDKGCIGPAFDDLEKKLNLPAVEIEIRVQHLLKLIDQGEIAKVLELSKKLLRRVPDSVSLLNVVSLANEKSRNFNAAVENYRQILKIKPDSAVVINNMGNALADQGKLEEAIEAYSKAIAIKPDYADAYSNMGLALKEQGKLEEAIKAYNEALAIKPDYADAYISMGNALKEQGKLDEAIGAYNKALAITPDYAAAYINMGSALANQGKLDEAIEAYKKSLSLNPDCAEAFNNMGNALKEQGMLDKAIEAINEAISLKPNYAEAHNNLGNALRARGKLKEAIEAYNEAISLKPNFFLCLENLGSINTQLVFSLTRNMDLTLHGRHLPSSKIFIGPKHEIQNAIRSFLQENFMQTLEHLNMFKACDQKLISALDPKDRVFCYAYNTFLSKLLEPLWNRKPASKSDKKAYHLGDSHCLSYAHRYVKLNGSCFKIIPLLTFGAKAFHFSKKTNNEFKEITRINLAAIPRRSKVFISFGEIDCRIGEGFIPAARKLNKSVEEIIAKTVIEYVKWFADQNKALNHDLFFLNVPAPTYNNQLDTTRNVELLNTICLFNTALEKQILQYEFNFFDIFKFTVGKTGFSNNLFNIDSRHLGGRAISEIEKQWNN